MSTKAFMIGGLLAASSFLPDVAFPWERDGHRIVGALADALLTGSRAEQEVNALLQDDGNLAAVSMWADCVKGACGAPTADMNAFAASHPNHHHYHYTNVSFQRSAYEATAVGASTNDVIHILTEAISILQGRTDASHAPHAFSPREALLLITHLVADIHQPLHVGSAYLNSDDEFVEPGDVAEVAAGRIHATLGGNWLLVDGSRSLHGYWDGTVVRSAMRKAGLTSPDAYAAYLLARDPEKEAASGDPRDWPRAWAADSLQLAKEAHRGLKVTARRRVTDVRYGPHFVWSITTPEGYDGRSAEAAEHALIRAGKRLALLLETIWTGERRTRSLSEYSFVAR